MRSSSEQMTMELHAIVHYELSANRVTLCAKCERAGSHHRGFADVENRVIHLDRGYATRSTVLRALHEIGHVVTYKPGMKRWEREQASQRWAVETMRKYHLPVPREAQRRARIYIARMARWGRNIAAGRGKAAAEATAAAYAAREDEGA